MATVYLARDLKHDRHVAIKVLHEDLAASLGAERFLREIQIAAKLSHPHILPLYDSGEAGPGLLYYVMPFVEGESLGDRMQREQQLPFADALQITREAADALAYAHSQGLVHRDIKPDNIMLSGGHAVVTDFGIARAVDAAGAEKLTQTGMAVGTPAYMSPEQAVGEQVDGRADIYSLGCVLYEMLVGQVPFTGPTPQAVMARHSIDAVPRPQIVRQTIPDELEDVILTALAKAPADRFRTAAEFSETLAEAGAEAIARPGVSRITVAARRRSKPSLWQRSARPAAIVMSTVAVLGLGLAGWQFFLRSPGRSGTAGETGLDPRRVAVLYFEDLTPEGELGHVADGLTEGLMDQLADVRTLDVISRNGVAPFRGADLARDSIARALEAGSLIEGSVESVGDRLRVVARLVDGGSGADFDRASFELPAGEFLAAGDSVAQEVSRILRERLGEEIRVRERRAGTGSVEAWSLVQRGERLRKQASDLRRQDDRDGAALGLAQADSLLELAQAADEEWIEPPLLRGQVAYQRSRLERGDDAVPWIESGYGHAERALELSANDPRALMLRGRLRYSHWNRRVTPDPEEWNRLLDGARQDLEAAVTADPTLTDAHIALSFVYYQGHDVPAAMLAARRAYEEDAYLTSAAQTLDRLFWGSWDLEQFNQARRWCAEGRRRFPDDPRFVVCKLWLMVTPSMPVDVEESWELALELETLLPGSPRPYRLVEAYSLVGGAIGRAGLPDSARNVLLRAREMATHESDPQQQILSVEAQMRTLIGDFDEAIDLLKRFVAANPDHAFEQTVDVAWYWRDLKSHPRFGEITRVAGR
jgi:serine/threonine-protein kinase